MAESSSEGSEESFGHLGDVSSAFSTMLSIYWVQLIYFVKLLERKLKMIIKIGLLIYNYVFPLS